MKWYAFKEDDKTYTMLLDHNTAATIPWISKADYEQTESKTATPSEVGIEYDGTKVELNENGLPKGTWDGNFGTNNRGPITLLNQLKIDTSNWVVTETLTDSDSYIAEWTSSNDYYTGNQKYTINYNGYKARLLSAEEINEVTGKGTNTLSNVVRGNFDTNCSSQGTCSAGTNNYGWLFDYTGNGSSQNCTVYGCNAGNNFDSYYWTMSPVAGNYNVAWRVRHSGGLDFTAFVNNSSSSGIRPVIKVSKDKLM